MSYGNLNSPRIEAGHTQTFRIVQIMKRTTPHRGGLAHLIETIEGDFMALPHGTYTPAAVGEITLADFVPVLTVPVPLFQKGEKAGEDRSSG